jgi:adenosylcobinamide kinase/adenosylcobinamide-phosphate guanylyltransferase
VGQLILVLGGARSGKSAFAQGLAQQMGGRDVLFVATAEVGDEEMRARVERHRRERPAGWHTLEVQRHVGQAILEHRDGFEVVLVDCLTVLIANRVLEFEDAFAPEVEAAMREEVEALVACARDVVGAVIVVSNEVGMGLVPPYPLGRAYRDLLGKANQVLAAEADGVYWLVAGLALDIKALGAVALDDAKLHSLPRTTLAKPGGCDRSVP